jgi:hypothetical protein
MRHSSARQWLVPPQCTHPHADPDHDEHGHDEHGDGVVELACHGHAGFSEYRIVLAVMPLPASPMDTYTGFERPGAMTRRTRIE